jgi:hypothetical protein
MSVSASELKPYVDLARRPQGRFQVFAVGGVLISDEVPTGRVDEFLGVFAAVKPLSIVGKRYPGGLAGSLLLKLYAPPPYGIIPQAVVSLLGDPVELSCSFFGGLRSGHTMEPSDLRIIEKEQHYLVFQFSHEGTIWRLQISMQSELKPSRSDR